MSTMTKRKITALLEFVFTAITFVLNGICWVIFDNKRVYNYIFEVRDLMSQEELRKEEFNKVYFKEVDKNPRRKGQNGY